MLRLDRTTRKLGVVLGGAVTTNQLNVIVSGVERIPSAAAQQAPVIGFTQISTTNNTTDVDICAAPKVNGHVREIESIYFRNGDTASAAVSIEYDDAGTDYVLFSATLAVGDFVAYSYLSGWQVFDTNGNAKASSSFTVGATLVGGTDTRVLFTKSGPVLGDDAEFTYNPTTNVLTVNGSTFGTNSQVGGTLGVTGVATFTAQPVASSLTASIAVFTDALKGLVSNAITGTGNVVMSTSPTLVTPVLGTPASATLTNATGLPISTGVSGLGTGVATFLGTPSSANLISAVSDETGTGALVFANTPTLVTPVIGAATGTSLSVSGGLTTTAGVLTASGTGTHTLAGPIDISGASAGQIQFPATQNASAGANVFDDCEKGTWTPVDSSGAGLSLTVTSAQYIKLSQLTHLQMDITYPTTANGSGAVVGGAPFTNQAVQGPGAAPAFTNCSLTHAWFMTASLQTLYAYTSAGVAVTNAQLSTFVVRLGFTHRASA